MGAAVALRLALLPVKGLVGVAFIRPAFSGVLPPIDPSERAQPVVLGVLVAAVVQAGTRGAGAHS